MDRDKASPNERGEPQHNWITFAMCAIGTFGYVSHDEAPPDCAWKLGKTQEETAENFKAAEAPFLVEIENVIHTFCETGSASAPSKAVAYFLGQRSSVLEKFFLKFSVGGKDYHSTVIPFPSLPVLRVVEWFFIDWWKQWGAWEAAMYRHLDDSEGKCGPKSNR
jgi:hypothetical protein